MNKVKWPDKLEELWIQGNFNKPLDGVKWPAGLKNIYASGEHEYNLALDGVPDHVTVILDDSKPLGYYRYYDD